MGSSIKDYWGSLCVLTPLPTRRSQSLSTKILDTISFSEVLVMNRKDSDERCQVLTVFIGTLYTPN